MPRKSALLVLLAISVCLITPLAQADSFVIGGQTVANATNYATSVGGASFEMDYITPSGPDQLGQATPGMLTTLQFYVPNFSRFNGLLGTSASLGNQSTDYFIGGITFKSTFTAPQVPYGASIEISVPVGVIGNVVAFQSLPNDNPGSMIFMVNFTGSGTMTLSIEGGVGPNGAPQDLLQGASMNYTGMATATTTVPEPSSLLLLGSGLAGIFKMRHRILRIT